MQDQIKIQKYPETEMIAYSQQDNSTGWIWRCALHFLMVGWSQFIWGQPEHSCSGEGNSNPLQCSFLENPRDGGAWWAAVYGVAQSWTWLKQLSSSSSSRTFMWQLSRGHRTGKGQCSFQSQRRAMPKNAQTTTQLHSSHTLAGEGNGTPLQYSCLENPMDGGAW